MEEYLDIVNEKGEATGSTCTNTFAHQKGILHRAAHVWIGNSNNQLLLQKRSSDKSAYPNYWDISASGHISAGESSRRGAQKETEEELGITIPENEFEYICTLEEHIVLNEGTYINNEFQDVYFVKRDISLETLKQYQNEEVSDVRWITLEEFKTMMIGNGELLVPHAEEYEKILSFLNFNTKEEISSQL